MNIGGPSHHVALLNEGLDALGYETILIVGTEDEGEGSMLHLATERNLRVVVVPDLARRVSLLKDARVIYSLTRLFVKEKPSIVHTHLSKAGFLGRIAAWLARVPIIIHTYHNFTFRDYFHPWISRLFLFLDIACARATDCILAISELQKAELLRLKVADKSKIKVIPLGLDLRRFADSKRDGGRLEDLGLTSKGRLVGAVGRLVPIKNLHLYLRAAASVRRVRQDIEFVLVGDGYIRGELQEYAKLLGISNVVHFTGWVGDVTTMYSCLDLVVISSDSEGTPVSLIESMAAGCPVVSTAVGGVPDFVTDGKTGRLVAKGDCEGLSKAILAVFDEIEVSREMARAAKISVLHKFSKERLVDDIDELYQRLLKVP